jgi:hypothetical protein
MLVWFIDGARNDEVPDKSNGDGDNGANYIHPPGLELEERFLFFVNLNEKRIPPARKSVNAIKAPSGTSLYKASCKCTKR